MIQTSKRFELVFLGSLPAIITVLLTLFFLASKHIGGLNHFMPMLPVLPIFYWGMMQARDMPYWFVFLIGLVLDSVMGLPLGLTSLLLIFFLLMVHAQRKYFFKEGFVIQWGYLALLLGLVDIGNWVTLSFFIQHSEPLGLALIQWFLTICAYPVMHKLFDTIYEYIHSRRWQILHGQ